MKLTDLKLQDLKNLRLQDINQLLTKNLTLLAVIVAILLSAYGKLLFTPQLQQISSMKPQLKKLKNDIARIQDLFANRDKLHQKRAELIERMKFYEAFLPSEKEIPALLEELSALARETEINIDSIEPLEIKARPTPASVRAKKTASLKAELYQKLPILIKGKSGYHQLGYFINKLENSQRFIEVSDMMMLGSADGYDQHGFTLEVVTYVLTAGQVK